MTRYLSQALEASEPSFGLNLRRLESSHGNPAHDIRLTAALKQQVRAKISSLQLDPGDTHANELYHALKERLKVDERGLTRHLQTLAATHVSAEANVLDGMLQALSGLPGTKSAFCIKSARFKTIVKAVPPKKAMKALGYRSVASFIKHESTANMLLAAHLYEDKRWHQSLVKQYKKLHPADFEMRPMLFSDVSNDKMLPAAERLTQAHKQSVIGLKELGVVILLPLANNMPTGTVVATLACAVKEMAEIQSSGTRLKLSQVRKDFGELVQQSVDDWSHPQWQLTRHYLATSDSVAQLEHLSPHLEASDFLKHSVEQVLAFIHPTFEFWEQSAALAFQSAHRPISFNVLDVALNSCNNLPFGKHVCHNMQQAVWRELFARYLSHEAVERTLQQLLQPQFAKEVAVAT